MSDETLEELIQQLNANDSKELIFIRPLAPAVDMAKIWTKDSRPPIKTIFPDRENVFYFFKNPENKYIGAVFDMKNDLHWYVLPAYRRQGYLTRNLNEVILPCLLRSREEVRISIAAGPFAEQSEKVALSVGFTKLKDFGEHTRYVLKAKDLKQRHVKLEESMPMPQIRYVELKNQIEDIARSLKIIKSELEMYSGTSISHYEELEDLSYALRSYVHNGLYEIWKAANQKKYNL
ncbi:hypothetical protein [Pontibacter sp. SGAir0037]|uniref:hypothetical protein n=1 Tax=Pontibacter sp. SGAir0037 TaxID=2571030 RepID=UPI0010CCD12B|nr:hypothetical protein [Pontibacter sp. SGAir0037]QCR24569.1 hypothetical protein C1N53_20885 [Pontibacter sp. SGAir0037]